MGFLHPPPAPAPVVIVRDIGGLVSDYKRQTEIFRAQGRELRLHECRSACTLALSLPNVCVYPHSVLRFHQAYNRDTKQVDHRISDELFSSYPEAIRKRLGYLTRQYKSIGGEELIALGIRNCNESPVLYARRKANERTQVAVAPQADEAPASAGLMGRLTGRLTSIFTGEAEPATGQRTRIASAPTTIAPKIALKATDSPIPLPPRRPTFETDSTPVGSIAPAEGATPPVQSLTASVPLPPRRPDRIVITASAQARFPKLITGAYPVLPQGLSAYAPLR